MRSRKKNTAAGTISDVLLPEVKQNLILDHDDDDELLKRYIANAVAYAESYQKKPNGAYSDVNEMPLTTRHAVVMLATHYYESRDGSTGGFFAVSVRAGEHVWEVINPMLRLERDWQV
jgi:uncharacterized phage protein (predicted DNA packaging)